MKKQVGILSACALTVILISASATGIDAGSTVDPCWGQATAVFARMGEMGRHASQEETPRLGLRNLSREPYEAGLLPDDSLHSLGVFVSDAFGLDIDACL
jgi:hypothetical protein